jgi:hypothetical protein
MSEEGDSFMELCLQGKVLPAEINDFVEAWNKTKTEWSEPLSEYLGMKKSEYTLWVRDPDALTYIVKARRDQVPLTGVVKDDYQQLRIAAGAENSLKTARLRSWLGEQGQRRWLKQQQQAKRIELGRSVVK